MPALQFDLTTEEREFTRILAAKRRKQRKRWGEALSRRSLGACCPNHLELAERGWGKISPQKFQLTKTGLRFADSAAELFLR